MSAELERIKDIPEPTLTAIKSLLSPYGVEIQDLTKKEPLEEEDHFMTIKETMAYLGVDRWYISKLIKSGRLPAVKLAPHRRGKVLISKNDLDTFLKSCQV